MILGFIAGLALYLAWASKDCFFRVEEGYLAVVVALGAAKHDGASLRLYRPGLHRKWPWERVLRVSVREQTINLSGEHSLVVMAEDGTVLRLDAALRFAPLSSDLSAFLFGTRAPIEHVTGLVSCILRNEIANFRNDSDGAEKNPLEDLGTYALIRRERQRLNERLAEAATRKNLPRYGVHFDAIDIVDVHPPEELASALNAVINAQTEAETHHFQTESACSRQVLAAREGVAIARARAEAAEKEIVTLGLHLKALARDGVLDDYVDRRRSEVLSDSRTVFLKGEASSR